ncbi:MAG: hypothetical protein U0936_24380 [Planctomycetaceae bacterium]
MVKKSSKSNRNGSVRMPPEKRFGPFSGGISIAVWFNKTESENGPKSFRTVTITPRRYLDRETGEWKDSSSYHINDIPALLLGLQQAQEYVLTTPLPESDQETIPSDTGERTS